ncbi:toll/interleukin-1 receptor domain-containing protein [Actinoplanes sp. Pm04-4]|uniref:Toll/interleukin-1 receptor domain-containing protein n=1 Tax=Paractinoplanes pyxinae TaxID=2997416 RepID=A0ABT4ASR2_9ACTN|nr:toll/interleukin-1 receptor domain-containing protein [Actinoplanes pyxinae]MCY1137285.1 toll/interleukin-1 receptor domain-containing protein [Actinoplanes pyxinae]
MDGHVFISYRHEDSAAYVKLLAAHLAAAGIPAWYDAEIVSGDRWLNLIRKQIESCSALVVVMTSAGEESVWVQREIALAQQRGKPILPLLLSGTGYFSILDVHFEDVRNRRMPGGAYTDQLRRHLPSPFVSARVANPATDVRPQPDSGNSAPPLSKLGSLVSMSPLELARYVKTASDTELGRAVDGASRAEVLDGLFNRFPGSLRAGYGLHQAGRYSLDHHRWTEWQ